MTITLGTVITICITIIIICAINAWVQTHDKK